MHTKLLLTYLSHDQYINNDQSQYTGNREMLLGMIFMTTDKHRNIPKRKTPYYHDLSTTR